MEEMLAKLAISAGSLLVKAVVTDGYELVRSAVLKLWRRHEPDEAAKIERTLETTHAELTEATEADAAQVVEEFDADWQTYFRALLRSHPEAADDVREVVEELKPLIAANSTQHAGDITQTANVRDRSISVQAGNSANVNIGKHE
jgi:hypothetical protein